MVNQKRQEGVNLKSGQGRVPEIDILRGFALFGVLLVNLRFMSSPNMYWQYADVALRWPELLHQTADGLIQVFVVAKFLSLFSFLFGMGFGMMMQRAEQHGVSFITLYIRRLVALAMIGLLHSLIIWYGDILTTYAFLGFLLLLFSRSSQKSLLRWAFICLLVPVIMVTALGMINRNSPTTNSKERIDELVLAERSISVYRSNDIREIASQRLIDVGQSYARTIPFLTFNFAMFLFGLYVKRHDRFTYIIQHRKQLYSILRWSFFVGLTCNIGSFVILREYLPASTILGILLFLVGVPGLALFYASSVLFLIRREPWKRWSKPFASVGRTALSNYLLQSVIGTTLFYGYGLGLYAKWGPATDLPLALIIFALQASISTWWLNRFRFGPAEWLWRSITYARWLPMRRT